MERCCGNCEFGHWDKTQGYICKNDESEYFADYVVHEHWCEEFLDKEET